MAKGPIVDGGEVVGEVLDRREEMGVWELSEAEILLEKEEMVNTVEMLDIGFVNFENAC